MTEPLSIDVVDKKIINDNDCDADYVDTADGNIGLSRKKDLLKLPHLDGDLVSKANNTSCGGNAKMDESIIDDFILKKRFITKFNDEFRLGLKHRRFIPSSHNGVPKQILCIIDDDFLFNPHQWFFDELAYGISGVTMNEEDESFYRYKNAITKHLDKIRGTPLTEMHSHGAYNAKTLVICDKPITYDYKLNDVISDDIDAYYYPTNGFKHPETANDKMIKIVGRASTTTLRYMHYEPNSVILNTTDDAALDHACTVGFYGGDHNYANCKYVPCGTTQLMISLDLHTIGSTSFLDNLKLFENSRYNGGLDNVVTNVPKSNHDMTVEFLAMDKFIDYEKDAKPLTGDVDKFLDRLYTDDSTLLLLATLKRFLMLGKHAPIIYLRVENENEDPIYVDIKNYTIYTNKDSFMFLRFPLSSNPETIERIKNSKTKLFYFDITDNCEKQVKLGFEQAIKKRNNIGKMVMRDIVSNEFDSNAKNKYLQNVVDDLKAPLPSKRQRWPFSSDKSDVIKSDNDKKSTDLATKIMKIIPYVFVGYVSWIITNYIFDKYNGM